MEYPHNKQHTFFKSLTRAAPISCGMLGWQSFSRCEEFTHSTLSPRIQSILSTASAAVTSATIGGACAVRRGFSLELSFWKRNTF